MSIIEVPFGTIKDGKIILNPWKDQSDRVVGEIREEGQDFAVNYFVDRFKELAGKVEELEQTIAETENKGSYLQKVLHLREALLTYDGLGDFLDLDQRLEKLQEELAELVAKNRVRNTEIKRTLITELSEAVELISWDESTEAVQDIKSRWIKVGNAVKEQQDALNDEFWGEVQKFFDRKRAFFEDKRRLQKKNEQDYWDLVKEANTVSRLSGDQRQQKIDELKSRWHKVGNIPSRFYKPLLQKFQNNLKRTSRPNFDPAKQLDYVGRQLVAFQQGNEPFESEKAQDLRKTLFGIRSRDPKVEQRKQEYLSQLQLLSEMDFVEKLAKRRESDYENLGVLEQNQLQVKILRELIKKEEEEVSQFEENIERFTSKDQGADRMMTRRLAQQKDRIVVKKRLITMLGG